MPEAYSGDIERAVPSTAPIPVKLAESEKSAGRVWSEEGRGTFLTRPKSRILARPAVAQPTLARLAESRPANECFGGSSPGEVTMMFSVLRSRCTSPVRWASASPSAT